MDGRPLVIEALRLDVEHEAPFAAFYHHEFLPSVVEEADGITGSWRYQEHQVSGSLRYYRKHFLTIHECSSEASAGALLDLLARRHGETSWGRWSDALHDVEDPRIYRERWRHARQPLDGIFGSRPFFMVSVELAQERAQAFHDWYERDYLPRNVADVPGWVGCRRYSSAGRTPERHLAIYEAGDLHGLDESLEAMRAPFRLKENLSWQAWDSGPKRAILWEDAGMYRPVYRRP